MKRIAVVTNSRAEYGHVKWLMEQIRADGDLQLLNIVMGAHMSAEFGYTYRAIQQDGFILDDMLDTTLASDTQVGVTKSLGLLIVSMADSLRRLRPDWLVILGDRVEMLGCAVAAHLASIPIAHLHGGETTEGAVDEAFRHAITKMSLVHFPSTQMHANRIVQLGESPERVFNFGAPGLDGLHKMELFSKAELEAEVDWKIDEKTALVTFHPETLEKRSATEEIDIVVEALKKTGCRALFTGANADAEGRAINEKLQALAEREPEKFKFVHSLGQKKYFSAMKNFPFMLGNSSSGIIESGSFSIPCVNIGGRQQGRERGENTVDVVCSVDAITEGIRKAVSAEFRTLVQRSKNPYAGADDGNISMRIKNVIKEFPLSDDTLKKKFYYIKV